LSESSICISGAELREFATAILHAAGVERALAEEWAKVLVWANLRGHDSHGVLRIPRYLDLLRRNAINATPNMRIERRAGAIVVLEADRAPGAVAMSRAMQEAIACARTVHVGWCAARNITHAGAIGYFARQAAEAGMAGIVMAASGPMMAYHGARVSGVSTNPLAIAVPGKTRSFLLDMSTSTVAMGKVLDARDKGAAIPAGWGLDSAGHDTTDPQKIATLLPLGGPKGSGLSLMIECLASLAIGNPLIAPALTNKDSGDNPVLNGVAIAIDLAALGDADAFVNEVEQLAAAISELPRAEGVERILLPGERGDRMYREREAGGIPIPNGTWSRLLAAAASVGVKPPDQVSA
jgi:ureidoglycolate dehydrogenase (NAD+)